MIAGGFEEAAVLRRLRERLWRAVWVQRHAYDWWNSIQGPPNRKGGVAMAMRHPDFKTASEHGDRLFEEAVQNQEDMVDEAERLGFRGRKEWLA